MPLELPPPDVLTTILAAHVPEVDDRGYPAFCSCAFMGTPRVRFNYDEDGNRLKDDEPARRWAAHVAERVSTLHEPGECGECHYPEQFEWDPIRWESGAPVIVCKTHAMLAPGWAYTDDTIGAG